MRVVHLRITALLGAGLLLVGTACRERQEGEGLRTTVYDKAEQATKEREKTPALTPPQREEYLEWAQERLENVEKDFQQLQQKIDKIDESASMNWLRSMENLRREQAIAREKLDRLTEAGGGAWQELQADLQKTIDELEADIRQISAKLPDPAENRER